MNELPKGWAVVTLEAIVKVEWGNTSITKKAYVPNGYPAFSASGKDGFLPRFEWDGPAVILSAIGARCGKCFYADGEWTAIKNTIVLQGNKEFLDHKLLYYYLNDENGWEISGSGQPFITMGRAQRRAYPLAPFNEQRRMVAKLEELLSRVEAAQQRLATIPRILRRFRQSVLAAACSGQLTVDWRGKVNPLESKSAEADLPSTWEVSSVSEQATIASGQTSAALIASCGHEGDVPWFRVSDMNLVGNEKFMETSQTYLSTEQVQHLRVKIFPAGSIIFPKRGGAILTNKKRLLNKPSSVDLNLMVLTPKEEIKAYFWIWFLTVNLGALSDGSNVPQINNPDILPLKIPIPPLNEQQEIVRRVEALFRTADELEARYLKAKAYVDKLKQSILAKAFRGELVPQDPNDEPASVLLERIAGGPNGSDSINSRPTKARKRRRRT